MSIRKRLEPGQPVTEELIRSMKPDDPGRDFFTEEERVEAWRIANQMHHRARTENPGDPNKR